MLGEPFEFAGDAREVGCDFVFVDFDAFDAVGEVIELFFDYVLWGGYEEVLEGFSDGSFDVAQTSFFS